MLVALLLSLVVWSSPPPTLWLCAPGVNPSRGGVLECERLHYQVIGKWRL